MRSIEVLTSTNLLFRQRSWVFADDNRDAIEQAWNKRVHANPCLWNGEVLIAHDVVISNGVLSAGLSKTDYASFLVWRDWGWPDTSVFNLFGMGVVRSRDGALVFGEMASHTANAGIIYPPGGSLEPKDVRPDGRVDLDGSIRDEVREEIGLDVNPDEAGVMFAAIEGQRIAVVKEIASKLSFRQLEAIFADHAAALDMPELSRLVAVRSPMDISDAMPAWAKEVAKTLV
jgi:8-oxo-dGTP pyrophosphatase MutT (NUDIX family)